MLIFAAVFGVCGMLFMKGYQSFRSGCSYLSDWYFDTRKPRLFRNLGFLLFVSAVVCWTWTLLFLIGSLGIPLGEGPGVYVCAIVTLGSMGWLYGTALMPPPKWM